MDDMKSVLGGGQTPTPFHDFMSGVKLNFITDETGVKKQSTWANKTLG